MSSWLTNELMKDYLIWYLNNHNVKEIYNLVEEAIVEHADLLYNPSPLYEDLPPLHFNILNQCKITKNDSLLSYVLTHKLEDGMERNAVVFKNLAPVLVALNLGNDKEILNKIIKNCPGKTLGELNGWIRKAKRGELHLNKNEVNKWCRRHGIV